MKWDCVEVGAENSWNETAQVCNVKEFKEIQEFEDLSEFKECGECSPSVKDGSFHFERFQLANHGNYSRVDSKEDCQTLCDLAEGCNFFVYEQTHVKCFLKYGVGKKVSRVETYFDSRSNPGGLEMNEDNPIVS